MFVCIWHCCKYSDAIPSTTIDQPVQQQQLALVIASPSLVEDGSANFGPTATCLSPNACCAACVAEIAPVPMVCGRCQCVRRCKPASNFLFIPTCLP